MSRSYKAARRAALHDLEPVEFSVDYDADVLDVVGNPTGETVPAVRVFVAKGDISGLTLAEFADISATGSFAVRDAGILPRMLREAFGDDRAAAEFSVFAGRHLDDDQVAEILFDLVEDFAGRPTQRLSGSPSTSSTTGQDSRVASLPGGVQVQLPEPQDHKPKKAKKASRVAPVASSTSPPASS